MATDYSAENERRHPSLAQRIFYNGWKVGHNQVDYQNRPNLAIEISLAYTVHLGCPQRRPTR
jgi:hypothetical protein